MEEKGVGKSHHILFSLPVTEDWNSLAKNDWISFHRIMQVGSDCHEALSLIATL